MFKAVGEISETGIGMFSGEKISLSLSEFYKEGIWFKNKNNLIQKLKIENIIVENNNTSIIFEDNTRIMVIEHLLSAIFAYGIVDILIHVDGDEIPLFDGSANGYIYLLEQLILEKKKKSKLAILTKEIIIKENDFYVKAKPSNKLIFDYKINFEDQNIKEQEYNFIFSKQKYIEDISHARTFGIVDNLEIAKEYYKGSTLENTIIISKGKLLSKLRDDKEFVKHKILDAIGDIRTFQYPIIMKYESYGGSHKLNNLLLKKIKETDAVKIIEIKERFWFKNKNLEYAKAYT